MFDFHKDKEVYFSIQYRTSKEYIIPFVESVIRSDIQLQVLEIGCAEAGVLKAFTELGHICTGIELSKARVELAKEFMKTEMEAGQVRFLNKNIYDIDIEKDIGHQFDLIILKDVIEHIHDQQKFMTSQSIS